VQSLVFSEKLKKTLDGYHSRATSTLEVIGELIKLAKVPNAATKAGGRWGSPKTRRRCTTPEVSGLSELILHLFTQLLGYSTDRRHRPCRRTAGGAAKGSV
jgi:hypothetical protein